MSQWFLRATVAMGLAIFCLPGMANSPVAEYKQIGVASYYSDRFQGRRTASGERYDRNDLTAVHSRLPFGTIIKVTNLRNQRSVHLRINDRRRFRGGRLLDVSKRAAHELGFVGSGLAKVAVEVVRYGDS